MAFGVFSPCLACDTLLTVGCGRERMGYCGTAQGNTALPGKVWPWDKIRTVEPGERMTLGQGTKGGAWEGSWEVA